MAACSYCTGAFSDFPVATPTPMQVATWASIIFYGPTSAHMEQLSWRNIKSNNIVHCEYDFIFVMEHLWHIIVKLTGLGRANLVHCACWYRLIRILWFRSMMPRIRITATWTKVATVFRAITKTVPSNLLIVWTPSSAISCETLDPIWPWFYTNSPQM